MVKMDDLRWVRAFSADIVPKYLVEQIKKRDFSVEDFYGYHSVTCLRNTADGPTLNPLSQLYVMANPENMVKGLLWIVIDPLTKDLVIQTYSVDKEYWKEGGAMEKVATFVKEIRSKCGLKKIYWITDYPKHSQRHGFKPSKSVLMEYSEGEENGENTIRGREARGTSSDSDAGSPEIPERTDIDTGPCDDGGVCGLSEAV